MVSHAEGSGVEGVVGFELIRAFAVLDRFCVLLGFVEQNRQCQVTADEGFVKGQGFLVFGDRLSELLVVLELFGFFFDR